jgi:hypothetical protein
MKSKISRGVHSYKVLILISKTSMGGGVKDVGLQVSPKSYLNEWNKC